MVPLRFLLLLPIAVLVTTSCRPEDPASEGPSISVPFEHRFDMAVGDRTVTLRLAVRPYEMQRGLMFIDSLPEDEGMLFVYQQPQQLSFWMRNTNIPLDIGYFDPEGRLREIYPMYPHVEDPVPSRGKDIQFALEMNQGWFARHEVKPGAQLDFAALREALRQRGFDPDDFLPAEAGAR